MFSARLAAERSKDPNCQVGAVIVNKSNRVVAGGYNGFPHGFSDDWGFWSKDGATTLDTKYPYVVHAEQNAVANWYHRESGNYYRIFVTKYPCADCAKLLVQSGIKEVIYAEEPPRNKETYMASEIMFEVAGVTTRRYMGRRSVTIDLSRADPKPKMATIKFSVDEGAAAPTRATPGSAGWDIRAASPAVIPAGGSGVVRTGVRTEFPVDTVCLVKGRSGLAFKHGVTAFEGTVDSDYRGEVNVLLFNNGTVDFHVEAGDRVAQLVFLGLAPHEVAGQTVEGVVRGEGGFGSTGTA
jgi:dCMP deaminase